MGKQAGGRQSPDDWTRLIQGDGLMYSRLAAKNRGLQREALAFAQQLIRTASPSSHEANVAQLVERQLRAVGYDQVFVDDFGNVVGVVSGRQTDPAVLLCSHMDTTDADAAAVWQDSPYSGQVRDGVLYGLGASDCKAGLAAQVYAGALLRRAMLPLRGHVIVAATVSEEQGGSPGLRHLMQKTLPSLGLWPDFAILGEPTSLGIYYGHDGSAVFEVMVEGADRIQVNDATRAVFDRLRSQYRSNAPLEVQSLGNPRFQQFERSSSGVIDVCRRLPDRETVAEALEQIKHEARSAVASVAHVAVEATVRQQEWQFYTNRTTILEQRVESWSLDPYHPLISRSRQALDAAGCKVFCGKFQLPRLGMGTAGGVLLDQFKVPAIAYGPGSEDSCHRPNESVRVDRVSESIYGTAAIVHSLVGVPVCGWTVGPI
jgi:acetylornithine deacetylase/succinyl-diaminopimelate desuccinylase-like protein